MAYTEYITIPRTSITTAKQTKQQQKHTHFFVISLIHCFSLAFICNTYRTQRRRWFGCVSRQFACNSCIIVWLITMAIADRGPKSGKQFFSVSMPRVSFYKKQMLYIFSTCLIHNTLPQKNRIWRLYPCRIKYNTKYKMRTELNWICMFCVVCCLPRITNDMRCCICSWFWAIYRKSDIQKHLLYSHFPFSPAFSSSSCFRSFYLNSYYSLFNCDLISIFCFVMLLRFASYTYIWYIVYVFGPSPWNTLYCVFVYSNGTTEKAKKKKNKWKTVPLSIFEKRTPHRTTKNSHFYVLFKHCWSVWENERGKCRRQQKKHHRN